MKIRYYITGSQLGMLMGDTDEKRRMKLLNEIMNNQQIEKKFKRIRQDSPAYIKGKEAIRRLRGRN